jgi:hypothetical protein
VLKRVADAKASPPKNNFDFFSGRKVDAASGRNVRDGPA